MVHPPPRPVKRDRMRLSSVACATRLCHPGPVEGRHHASFERSDGQAGRPATSYGPVMCGVRTTVTAASRAEVRSRRQWHGRRRSPKHPSVSWDASVWPHGHMIRVSMLGSFPKRRAPKTGFSRTAGCVRCETSARLTDRRIDVRRVSAGRIFVEPWSTFPSNEIEHRTSL